MALENMELSNAVFRALLEPVYWFRAVLYPKVSFFIKQLTNTFLLCEIYQRQEILDAYLWIKCSRAEEKHGNFLEIIQHFFLSIQQATIQNNLDRVKTIDFNSK